MGFGHLDERTEYRYRTKYYQRPKDFPQIIVLCGSTRFHKEYDNQNLKFTMEGKIVLTIGTVTSSDLDLKITPQQKQMLDELHLRKIDMADRVFIINKNGYIGDSTRSEIKYAKKLGKPIEYLEEGGDGL